jgi:hypothetical protein
MKISHHFLQLSIWSISALAIVSCTETTDPVSDTDIAYASEDLQANQAFEDLDYLTMSAIETSGIGARVIQNPQETICKGVSITQDTALKKITIDFGAGCKSSDGIERKGKVYIVYSGSLMVPGSTISASFDGFEVDGIKIQGSRTMTTTGFNLFENSISLSVKIKDGKVIFPDGKFITYESVQTRTIKMTATGYLVKINGTSTGISTDKVAYTSTIITPLEINKDCVKTGIYVPSAGVMEFGTMLEKITIDFGTGKCDKIITITTPSGTKEITLD